MNRSLFAKRPRYKANLQKAKPGHVSGVGIHAPNVALSYIEGNIEHPYLCRQVLVFGEKARQGACRLEESAVSFFSILSLEIQGKQPV